MKVELIATITANGQLLLTENRAQVSAPPQVMGVFVQKAREAGNIVIGHATYNMIMQAPEMKQAFAGIEKVVLTHKAAETPDYKAVSSPGEAVRYLKGKGYHSLILAGGKETYNAFLNEDLVTDMYLSIVPVIVGNGGILATEGSKTVEFRLSGQQTVAEGILQLHFSR